MYCLEAKVFDKAEHERPAVNLTYATVLPLGQLKVMVKNVTALHDACKAKCERCAKNLLVRGIDPDVEMSMKGFPAWFEVSIHPWMYEAMQDYRTRGTTTYRYPSLLEVRPIHFAAKAGCDKCIDELAKHHAVVDATMTLGYEESYYNRTGDRGFEQVSIMGLDVCFISALDLALAFDHKLVATKLIKAGAATTPITVDSEGKLLNMSRCLRRQAEAVVGLLQTLTTGGERGDMLHQPRLEQLGILNATTTGMPQILKCKHWTASSKAVDKDFSTGALMRNF